MLRAVVTTSGGSLVDVRLIAAEEGDEEHTDVSKCEFVETDATGKEICGEGPSPITPEVPEIVWGAGAFVVFALLMRLFLYPRMKKGMDARYGLIRDGHETAEAARTSARSEVAEYEAALAEVKAVAAAKVDAARLALDGERSAALVEANARIAAKREAAAAEADAAREAVRSQIESAVADVASRAVELGVGRRPDPAVVAQAVSDTMSVGVR